MPRISKEQRTARAKELIREHPDWGRARVCRVLRSELGAALRYTVFGGLKRSLVGPRRVKYPPPAVAKKVFRTRRQRHYEVLIAAGFTPFEARPLSRVPFKIPYIAAMIRERHRDMQQAIKAGWSRMRWLESIKRSYVEKGWVRMTRLGKRVYDPWRMLRQMEERYRAKYPSYSSPWQKRQRDFRRFIAKLEATISKYPSRMPRVKLRYLETGGAEIIKE